MKLIYSALTIKDGLGGHYRSLVTLAQIAIELGHEITIISLGYNKNKVFDNSDIDIVYINLDENSKKIKKQLNLTLSKINYDCIHCFDEISFYFFQRESKKILLTKCGGPNPKLYYPASKHLSLFSLEDLDYFKRKKKYNKSLIEVIPNRVKPFSINKEKISRIKKIIDLKDDEIVILKISRITKKYSSFIEHCFELIENLKSDKVKLVIVGAIHDSEVFNNLKAESEFFNNVFFFTEDEYTINAKEILDVCDIFIGLGRSLMEATSLKKIVCTHVGSGIVLVNRTNFDALFRSNFSGRASIDFSKDATVNVIKEIIRNARLRKDLQEFSYEIYLTHFDVYNGFRKYTDLYHMIQYNNECISISENILLSIYVKYKLYKERKARKISN